MTPNSKLPAPPPPVQHTGLTAQQPGRRVMMAAGPDPSLRRLADAAAGPVRLAAAPAGPVRLPGAGPVSRAQLYQRRRNVLRLTLKRLNFCWLDDGRPCSKT
jgi:hypothetical protein